MAPPSELSPVTTKPVPSHYIHSSSAFFQDTKGRHLLLRGVNLSGSAKSPVSQPSDTDPETFWSKAEAGGESFVGRPLKLDDGSADVHLARLRGWGFGVLRYVVTWESLEREGPGIYDHEFMDYTVQVLRKCKEYGFKVYMDPHQDVWSRFAGGSGAPYWTLPACGFEPRNFTATQAAILHCEYPDPQNPDPANYPAMIWTSNYRRVVAQVMFTLFYAGRDFAPLCIIDGVNIQDYLQSHFNNAMAELADKIRDAGDLLDECVIGWDSLNEPHHGLVGLEDLSKIPASQFLKKGPVPAAFEAMRMGMGQSVAVENWKFGALGPAQDGFVTFDPKGIKCWMDPSKEADGSRWGWKRDPKWKLGTCIWALHGVWDPLSASLLKPNYFRHSPTDSFVADYWRPTWEIWARKIRQSHPECIHFVQPPVFHAPPELDEAELAGRACVSGHYYDGLTLLTRHWNWFNIDLLGVVRGNYPSILAALRIGERAVRQVLQDQLGVLQQDTFASVGQYPTLVGEIGIPYDMDEKKAYGFAADGKGKGDYGAQMKAFDASLAAADGPNMLSYTIWTYCVDNSHKRGDGWNLEDLSLWSPDDVKIKPTDSLNSSRSNKPSSPDHGTLPRQTPYTLPKDILIDGARAVGAFSRPYPTATVGQPTRIVFDIKTSAFEMTVEVRPGDVTEEGLPTEIYLPWIHYRSENGFHTTTSLSPPTVSIIGPHSSALSLAEVAPARLPSFDLAVDVQISAGRFILEGQLLKWFYPASTDGRKIHSIKIKRRGGAFQETVEGGGVQSGSLWRSLFG